MGNLYAATDKIVISPEGPLSLGASNSNHLPWSGVESHLEANALAIWESGQQYPLIFLTLDLLYPGQRVRSAIERAIAPVPPERLVVAASHTHRAPMTDETKPGLGLPDPDYLDWLVEELSTLIRYVLTKERIPVSFAAGTSLADHSINRRLRKRFVLARPPRINQISNAPNPQGSTDELVTAILVTTLDGEPFAVLWNYACHPVDGPTLNAVSGHFPSEIRDNLRAEFSDDQLPILFFQGFSGNVRPSATAGAHTVRRRLQQRLFGPLFERMTHGTYKEWTAGLTQVLLRALAARERLTVEGLFARRLRLPSDRFVSSDSALEDVSIARIDLGAALSFITVSAEVVVEYADHVRAMLPNRYVMCVGCTDQVIGYAPTSQILSEGGYEAERFCEPFGLLSVNPGVEPTLIDSFEQLTSADTCDT